MLITYSESERGSVSSSSFVSLCGVMTVKKNNGDGWSSNDEVLWLGRR
jgi:hypothetical protein